MTGAPDVSGGIFGTPDSEANRWIRGQCNGPGQVRRVTVGVAQSTEPAASTSSTSAAGSADQGSRTPLNVPRSINEELRAEFDRIRRQPTWTAFTSTR